MASEMKKAAPPPDELLNYEGARRVYFDASSDRLVQLWVGKKQMWGETQGLTKEGAALLAEIEKPKVMAPLAAPLAESITGVYEVSGEKIALGTPPLNTYKGNPFARFLVAGEKIEAEKMTPALMRKAESVEVPHYCKDCNKIWDYNCRFHMGQATYRTVATQIPEVPKEKKERKAKKTKGDSAEPTKPVAEAKAAPIHPATSASPVTFSVRAATVLNIAPNVTVIPVPAKEKGCKLPKWEERRTNDGMQIARWNDADPNQNCGVVASHDDGGIWFVDDDLGTLANELLKDTGYDISGEFTVKTADGFHYYFLQDAASRAQRFGEKANSQTIDTPGYKGEARCNNQYVMSPLSVHPDGPVYQIVNNVPLKVAPPVLLKWLQQRYQLSESLKTTRGGKKAKSQVAAAAVAAPASTLHGAVKNADGTVTIYPEAPVEGFKKLFAAVGWVPVVRRMRDLGFKVTEETFIAGRVFPCPMPESVHKHKDYSDCFGVQASNPVLVHCCGNCNFSGDLVKAVFTIDDGEETYGTMYDAARTICEEENLRFEDYFPLTPRAESKSDGFGGMKTTAESFRKERVAEETAKGTDPLLVQQIVAAENTRAGARTIRLIKLSSRSPKNLVWLWPSRILANTGNLIYGEPGLGKGFTGTDFIARMTTGRDFPDCKNTNELYNAIICCDEDDMERTIIPRLKVAGADMDHVFCAEISTGVAENLEEGNLRLDTDLPALTLMMAEHPDRPFILLIDPVAAYVGDKEPNKDREMRPLYMKMDKWARTNGVTLVLIAHPNKNQEASAVNSVSGAKSLVTVFRNVWVVIKNNEDKTEKLLLSVKGNLVSEEDKKKGLRFRINKVLRTGFYEKNPDGTDGDEIVDIGKLEWTGETDMDADDVRLEAASGGKELKQKKQDADAQTFLKDALKEGARRAGDMFDEAARLGITEWGVKKAKAVVRPASRRIQDAVYWAMSEADLDAERDKILAAQRIVIS